MEKKEIIPHLAIPLRFNRIITPYIGEHHLDFGCGKGWWSRCIAEKHKQIDVYGYDPSAEEIKIAKELPRTNVWYISSEDDLYSLMPFDSATLTYVLHETDEPILGSIYDLLKPDGVIGVLDYHMKGKSEEKFKGLFAADYELEEIGRLGFEKAYETHTAKGLEECIEAGEKAGFKDIKYNLFYGKYFIWVGKKIETIDKNKLKV